MVIELPPVEPDLFRFVDRADEQPDANGEQLDFRQRHLDIARHDQSLVENAIEHVDQTGRSPVPLSQWRRHKLRILRNFLALAESLMGEEQGLSQQWQCQADGGGIPVARDRSASKPDSELLASVRNCYKAIRSRGASTTCSSIPNSARGKPSNPNPYRTK